MGPEKAAFPIIQNSVLCSSMLQISEVTSTDAIHEGEIFSNGLIAILKDGRLFIAIENIKNFLGALISVRRAEGKNRAQAGHRGGVGSPVTAVRAYLFFENKEVCFYSSWSYWSSIGGVYSLQTSLSSRGYVLVRSLSL
jgi:hypothetical protein